MKVEVVEIKSHWECQYYKMDHHFFFLLILSFFALISHHSDVCVSSLKKPNCLFFFKQNILKKITLWGIKADTFNNTTK